MTDVQPKLVSIAMANRYLNDASFLKRMPEFLVLKQMYDNAFKTLKTGCSSCAQRRRDRDVGIKFLQIINSLPADRIAALKQHIGVTSLMLQGINKTTNKYETRII